jgi:hypothetical protein
VERISSLAEAETIATLAGDPRRLVGEVAKLRRERDEARAELATLREAVTRAWWQMQRDACIADARDDMPASFAYRDAALTLAQMTGIQPITPAPRPPIP